MSTGTVFGLSAPLAHAFGQRYDSPVPLALFLLAGALVVLVSFALVYRRAVEPASSSQTDAAPADDVALADLSGGRPNGSGAGLVRALPPASVVLLLLLVLAGVAGAQEVADNLLPVWFWLVVWVVLPLVVGLVGDFTQPVNPFAAIARAADREPLRRAVLGGRALPWPRAVGYWVFALLYVVVVFAELVVNTTATLPRVTATALVVYALICATGGLVFGAPAWNSRAELFTVMFSTWGRLGWFRFHAAGRRGLGGGLDVPFDASISRLVGVLLLLVSVSFDGLLSTPHWTRWLAHLPTAVQPGSTGYLGLATLTLLTITVAMLGLFGLFAAAAARAGEHRASGVALTGLLPSLLPIAYGYLLAHYLQYVLVNGQLLMPLLGNPVGLASWPIHLPYPFNDSYEINTGIMPTSVVWYVQIVVIVAAHVLAVVLAHRHLGVQARDVARARRSEWPWLVAMVAYTMISLWLLAQPLVAEHADEPAPATTASAVALR